MGCAASSQAEITQTTVFLAKIFDAVTQPERNESYRYFEEYWDIMFRSMAKDKNAPVSSVQHPSKVLRFLEQTNEFRDSGMDLESYIHFLPVIVEKANKHDECFVRKKSLWVGLLYCKYHVSILPMSEVKKFQELTRFYIAKDAQDTQPHKKYLHVLEPAGSGGFMAGDDVMALSTWYQKIYLKKLTKAALPEGADSSVVLSVY